ncbi:MAG: tetratricopeptide repeat protein [Candidatus Eremiobacteraeota bacterium]|nr:tetratricopeptide repeat protein [Candidatus Eremiobacteraeota bacterium]
MLSQAQKSARRGESERAFELFDQAVAGLAEHPGPHLQRGLAYLEQGRAEEALADFERAIALAPDNPAAPVFQCLAQADLDDLEGARASVERAAKLEPRNQQLPCLRALLSFKEKNIGEVCRHLGLVEEASPVELIACNALLGRLVVELEQTLLPRDIPELFYREAISEEELQARPALEEPGLIEALANVLPSLRAMSSQRRGQSRLEKAMRQRDPERRTDLCEEAVELQRRAYGLDSHMFRGAFHLAESLLFSSRPQENEPYLRERLEEASELLLESWKRDGPNPYVFYYLGRSEQLLGHLPAAETYFGEALKRFEKLFEANYGYGQCRLMGGHLVEARQRFLAAVTEDLQMVRERLRELAAVWKLAPDEVGLPMPEPPQPPPPPEPDSESPGEDAGAPV